MTGTAAFVLCGAACNLDLSAADRKHLLDCFHLIGIDRMPLEPGARVRSVQQVTGQQVDVACSSKPLYFSKGHNTH